MFGKRGDTPTQPHETSHLASTRQSSAPAAAKAQDQAIPDLDVKNPGAVYAQQGQGSSAAPSQAEKLDRHLFGKEWLPLVSQNLYGLVIDIIIRGPPPDQMLRFRNKVVKGIDPLSR